MTVDSPVDATATADRGLPDVVVVDDDPAVVALLEEVLGRRYAVHPFTDPREALDYVRGQPADVIVSDHVMAAMTGVAFLRETHVIRPDAKRIIVTGQADLETALAAVNEARIDAFLTKPIRNEVLYQTVERLWETRRVELERDRLAVQNAEMVEQLRSLTGELEQKVQERTEALADANSRLKKALADIEAKNRALTTMNESLSVQATVDPLTGLFNRREFHNRLTAEWQRFQRYGRPFSLIMLDIDHFKQVNDQHGHECGDTVLHALGELLRRSQRRQDVVCRYGGEEIVIILPETALDPAFHAADNLRRMVAAHTFRCGSVTLPIRISLGVSGVLEHAADSDADLLKIADQGLYRAKQNGRNRTVVVAALGSDQVLREGAD